MPEAAIIGSVAGAGAGAGVSGSGDPGAGTPGAGSTGGDSGAHAAGSGAAAPAKFSISFDEGGENHEFSLEESGGDGDAGTISEFKFDQLDPLREGEHAELYKTLKAELSAKSRFAKHFKNPEELGTHMERLGRLTEFVGSRPDGKVGIDAIEATVRELGQTLGNLQNGDSATVEKWFKDNPEGMATLTQHALSNLSKVDPKLATSLTAKAAMDFLGMKDASGFSAVDALNALYKAIPEGETGAQARQLLERVAHSVNQLHKDGQYKPDQTSIVDRQRKANEATAQKLWNKETDLHVEDILRPAAGKTLSALLNQIKKDATPEERQEFRAAMIADWYKEAGKDQNFVRRLNELRKTQDRAGIANLVRENRAKFLQAAAKNLYRAKLLNRAAVKNEGAAKQEGAGGSVTPKVPAVKYTGKLHPEKGPMVDMDFARMNAEGIEAMDRKFYIKGRKELFTW